MGEAKQDVFKWQEILPQALPQTPLHQTPQRTHPDLPRSHKSHLLPSIRHCPGALLHCCSDAPFCSSVQVTHNPLEPSPKWIPCLLLNLHVPMCNPITLRGTVRVPRPSPGLRGSPLYWELHFQLQYSWHFHSCKGNWNKINKNKILHFRRASAKMAESYSSQTTPRYVEKKQAEIHIYSLTPMCQLLSLHK